MINDKSFLDEDLLNSSSSLFLRCFVLKAIKECCYAIKADDFERRRKKILSK